LQFINFSPILKYVSSINQPIKNSTKEATVGTTIRIVPSLNLKLRKFAAKTGMSQQAIWIAALTEYLDRWAA
jgi:hypothetical protein